MAKGTVFQMVGAATVKLREAGNKTCADAGSKQQSDERRVRDGT